MWWRPLRALARGQAPPPHLFLPSSFVLGYLGASGNVLDNRQSAVDSETASCLPHPADATELVMLPRTRRLGALARNRRRS
jgi:hypothetical protein